MKTFEHEADDNYILPEYGDLKYSKRVQLLFSQLLDESFRKSQVKSKFMDYFLTCLLMELSGEFKEQENKDISEEISNIKNGFTITIINLLQLLRLQNCFIIIQITCQICLKRQHTFH